MSKEALAKVVQRAISDAAFRRQLSSDPAGALRGFDLTADETSAIRTGDAGRLSTLGVDQRMSKSFALGGMAASTRMSASDLTPGGGPSMVDDLSGAGGRTVIPADPAQRGSAIATGSEANRSADIDGGNPARTVRAGDDYKFAGRQAPDSSGTSTVRAGDDWKFEGRVAPDGVGTVRAGDDWKFADRSAGAVAPVEGSPEATAADMKGAGAGTAAYPAHDGLAGPSGAQSVRAGDDWARSSAAAADSGRIGTARLDDASGGASGGATAINDDPNGFLAANKDADFSNPTVRSAINDDPNGFLAANADAGGEVTRANVIHDDPDGFLAANADAGGSVTRANVIHDDPNGFLAANANADVSAGSAGTDAFIDESSEGYLTKVGYDPSVANTSVGDEGLTSGREATWSGDDTAGPSASEGNVDDHSGGSSLSS